MHRRRVASLMPILLAALAAAPAAGAQGRAAQAPSAKPLVVYVVDMEGGKAALWVAPSGESILVDTGSPGGRDADRIMAAVADAGLTRIDYVLSTHYHVDHIGGLQELAKQNAVIAADLDHAERSGPVSSGQRFGILPKVPDHSGDRG